MDAQNAYKHLAANSRSKVKNYSVLESALMTYNTLRTDNQAASNVDNLINAIEDAKYSDEWLAKIEKAEEAYSALSDNAKELVTKLSVLETARSDYNAYAATYPVVTLISQIGTFEYTDAYRTRLYAAVEAYENLSPEYQARIDTTSLQARVEEYEAAKLEHDAAQVVIDMIGNIAAVEYTDECNSKIESAAQAFRNLSNTQQVLVNNYDILVAAQRKYAELKADNQAADTVIALINSLGEVEYTDEFLASLTTVLEAYSQLTENQRQLVDNRNTLHDKEEEYRFLREDHLSAEAVETLINEIGTVSLKEACLAKIERAEQAYAALTSDAQRALVTNYEVLIDAINTYNSLIPPIIPAHEHSYSDAWSYDSTYHWHACTETEGICEAPEADKAVHNMAEIAVAETLACAQTATSPAVYYKSCSVCGYVSPTETFEVGTAGTTDPVDPVDPVDPPVVDPPVVDPPVVDPPVVDPPVVDPPVVDPPVVDPPVVDPPVVDPPVVDPPVVDPPVVDPPVVDPPVVDPPVVDPPVVNPPIVDPYSGNSGSSQSYSEEEISAKSTDSPLPNKKENENRETVEVPVNSIQNTLSMNTGLFSVAFDEKATAALAKQANGENIILAVEKIEPESLTELQRESLGNTNVILLLDISLTSDDKYISDFEGGTVNISVDLPKDDKKQDKYYHVSYLAEDGTTEEHNTKVENGKLSFSSGHFSCYVISYDENYENSAENAKESAPVFTLSKTLYKGSRFELDLAGLDKDAKITYTSSNKGIVSISKKGVITAKNAGKTNVTIVVETKGTEYKIVLNLTVKKEGWNYSSISKEAIKYPTGSLPMVNVYKSIAKYTGFKLNLKSVSKDAKVIYSSEDKSIANISGSGYVTGISDGITGVTATVIQGGYTYEYRLLVKVGKGDERNEKYLLRK